jgi:hypothetical protein
MSKTFRRSSASSSVRGSNSKVPKPWLEISPATKVLRGLKRDDPLPCAKIQPAWLARNVKQSFEPPRPYHDQQLIKHQIVQRQTHLDQPIDDAAEIERLTRMGA